jgi:hypothetical protein
MFDWPNVGGVCGKAVYPDRNAWQRKFVYLMVARNGAGRE